jgi:ParB/RepB/Spo0J family partition protein
MEDQLKLTKRDYYMVPVDLIDIVWEEDYAKPDRGDMAGLVASIRANGFRKQDPVSCSRDGDRFHVNEGFRRMWAVLKVINAEATSPEQKILRVPVIIAERYANENDRRISQILENSHRADASPLERAEAYRDLCNRGLEPAEIAARLGELPGTIDRQMLLLKAGQPLREALNAGSIGVTAAAEIIKASRDEEEQVERLDAAIKASGGEKATTRAVKAAQPRIRAPYRTTRHLKEVQGATKQVEQIIKTKGYRTDDEAEPAVWQGYLKALEWMNGGDAPW